VKRWVAAIPLLVLAAAVVLFAAYALNRPTARVNPAALVGRPLPSVSLAGLDEAAPRPLDAVTGRGPVLVNVFASWCVPCAVEHPELMRLKAEGVRIVGVAYKDEPAKSRAFLDRLGDPYGVALNDPRGLAGIELGISGVPETFAVDARGVIVAKHAGPMTRADALRLMDALKTGG
jgi:cytochrome c biogenesis protein CcmG/thiol:disulfide interchange protein DsbE